MKTSLITVYIIGVISSQVVVFAAAEQQSSWSGDGWNRTRNLRNRTKNRAYNNQAELTLAITKKNQAKKRRGDGIEPKIDEGTTTTKPERQKKQPKEENFWDKAITTPKPKRTQPIKPPCPTKYNTSIAYVAGDTVEVTKEIYVCQDPPYEEYCNLIEQDDNWNEEEIKLWKDAWLGIGKCEEMKDLKEELVLEEEEEEEEVSVAETEEEDESLPACPPPYNWSKTTYLPGEIMEMKSNIFVCRNGYEIYCNISHWSNSLLKEDSKAKKLWHEAWEHLGPCQVVVEEETEEEDDEENEVEVVDETETLEETLEEEIDEEENGL